jgi:hypothetical protein
MQQYQNIVNHIIYQLFVTFISWAYFASSTVFLLKHFRLHSYPLFYHLACPSPLVMPVVFTSILSNNAPILTISSGSRKGLARTSSCHGISIDLLYSEEWKLTIPALTALSNCAALAFAVTPMTGTRPFSDPSRSICLIR